MMVSRLDFCPLPAVRRSPILALLLLLAVAACQPTLAVAPSAAGTPPPTRQPFTLPPTWTPTPSATSAPPTATRTPTLTAIPLPTLSDADHCAAWALISHPADGARLVWARHRAVSFIWDYPLPGGWVTLTITRAGTEYRRTIRLPGPGTVVATVPFRSLFGPGVYRWSAAPSGVDGTPLDSCAASGRLSILLLARDERHYPAP